MREPVPRSSKELPEAVEMNPILRAPSSVEECVAVTLDDGMTQDHPLRSLRVKHNDPRFDAVYMIIQRIESVLTAALRQQNGESKGKPTLYAQVLYDTFHSTTQRMYNQRHMACVETTTALSSVLRLYIRELALLLARTPDELVGILLSAIVSGERVYTAIYYMHALEPFDFTQPEIGSIPLLNPVSNTSETQEYWKEQLAARKEIGVQEPTIPEIVALRSARLQEELEALKSIDIELSGSVNVVLRYLEHATSGDDLSVEEFARYCDEIALTRLDINDLFMLLNALAEIKQRNPVFFSEMMGVVPDGNPRATQIKKSALYASPLHIAFARTYENKQTPPSLKSHVNDLLTYNRQTTPLVYVDHLLMEKHMREMLQKQNNAREGLQSTHVDPFAVTIATIASFGVIGESYRMTKELMKFLEAAASVEHQHIAEKLRVATPKEFERILYGLSEQLIQHPQVQDVIKQRYQLDYAYKRVWVRSKLFKKEIVLSDDSFSDCILVGDPNLYYIDYEHSSEPRIHRDLWDTVPNDVLLESREWPELLYRLASTCAKKTVQIEKLSKNSSSNAKAIKRLIEESAILMFRLRFMLSAHPEITTEQWMAWYQKQSLYVEGDSSVLTAAGFLSVQSRPLFGNKERQALLAVWPLCTFKESRASDTMPFFRMLINDPQAYVIIDKNTDEITYKGKLYHGIGRNLYGIDHVILPTKDSQEKRLPILRSLPEQQESPKEMATRWTTEFESLEGFHPAPFIVTAKKAIARYQMNQELLLDNKSPQLIVLTPRDLGITEPCNLDQFLGAAHTFGFALIPSKYAMLYETIMQINVHPSDDDVWGMPPETQLKGDFGHSGHDNTGNAHMIFFEKKQKTLRFLPDTRIILTINQSPWSFSFL